MASRTDITKYSPRQNVVLHFELCALFIFQAKEDLKELMDKNNSSGVKGLADMDSRLRKLNKRLGEMEDAVRKLEKVRVKFLRKHNWKWCGTTFC